MTDDPAAPRHTNRLAREGSPYLQQHAHNPVDWFPWGEEAFAKARAEKKPVFLSIGYATCHWCHVMERESFENEEVAALLNARFVSIKVDREERPDVDEIYMGAVQALSGQGGWPLTAFLTADGKPFFGGTYFPQPARYGRPSFLDLLRHIDQVWREDNEKVMTSAASIAEHLAERARTGDDHPLDLSTLHAAFEQLRSRFDTTHGGFGTGTKFPTPHVLSFLFAYHARTRNPRALDMALSTLGAICERGLRDHLAGGFHRYAVDRAWAIPHFEKMLYDQALLVRALVEARLVSGDERWAEVARECLEFVLRDMRSPDGGFTSAWDADSEGVEGKCYVWTEAEVKALLGPDFAPFAMRYGVTAGGNFEEVHGGNHLQLAATVEDVARRFSVEPGAMRARLEVNKAALLEVRRRRVPPLHDDKVLADWNGLMIGACAVAARALGEPRWAEAAAKAADLVLGKMKDAEGRLMHRLRQGEVAVPGMLDDHAFLAAGLLDLYEATYEPRWLEASLALARAMVAGFHDAQGGGFFQVRAEAGLIHRPKPTYDGAIPAGNSVAALTLLRLGRLAQDPALEEHGRGALRWASEIISQAGGHGATQALLALDWQLGPVREVVVAGDRDDPGLFALLDALHTRYLPRTCVVVRPDPPGRIAELVPFVAAQGPVEGRPTAYVCRDYACARPVHEPDELRALLAAE